MCGLGFRAAGARRLKPPFYLNRRPLFAWFSAALAINSQWIDAAPSPEKERKMRTIVAITGLLALSLGLAWNANAQFSTVMLPSQHQFGVNTSVMVPDSGGVLLGRVNRAANGHVTRGFGPFTNRAFGKSLGASTASVHVYVIDLGEIDRRMQDELAAIREESYRQYVMAYPTVARAARITSDGRSQQEAISDAKRVTSGMSLADQRRMAEAEDAVALAEANAAAERALEKAQRAEKKGQMSVARAEYKIAARKGQGEVRRQGLEGYRRIHAATSKEVAQP